MKLIIDISKDRYDEIMEMDWRNCRRFFDEEIRAIHDGMPQRTGYWIKSPNDCFATCSECGLHGDKGIFKHYRWCPICGAKMVEPQESEGAE